MSRAINFGAGPAILPIPVLEELSRDIRDYAGTGMSILEMSHRGTHFEKIISDARTRLLKLMNLQPEQYAVLFLGGGASTQFDMIPMNFLNSNRRADYAITGDWALKAFKEAKRFGNAFATGSTEADRFSRIEKLLKLSPDATYFHLTSNNTIEGTQWHQIPQLGNTPLIGDLSSDILGRTLDHSRFSLIYAGAQKNLGPAGVTVVIIRREFLKAANSEIPTLWAYQTHVDADSLYNTPPVFAVHAVGLTLKWIEEQGGLSKIESLNRQKAAAIYSTLDEFSQAYAPTVTDKADRSLMNITFKLRDSALEGAFLAGAKELRMEGLPGHRSVGGFRASIYNAMPLEDCLKFSEYLRKFARRA